MYRLNRIGPWPFADLNQAPQGVTPTATSESTYSVALPDEVVRERTAAAELKFSIAIVASQQACFGISINGLNPFGQNGNSQDERPYFLQVAGALDMRIGSTDTNAPVGTSITWYLGRSDTASLTPAGTACTNVWQLAGAHGIMSNAVAQSNINNQFIVGRHNGVQDQVAEANPILFFCSLRCNEQTQTEDFQVRGSFSIYKWTEDLSAFDPRGT